MQKTTAFFLVCLLVLSFFTFAKEAATNQINPNTITIPVLKERSKEVTEFSYRSESKGKINSIAMGQKVWVKDGKARLESAATNPPSANTIGLLFEEGKGTTAKYQLFHPRKQSSVSSTFALGRFEGIRKETFLKVIDQLEADSSKIIGRERVYSRPCIIVEYQDGKVWIDIQKFVPLRIEDKDMITEFPEVSVGPGTVADQDLEMPPDAVLLGEENQPSPPDFPIFSEPYSKNKPLTKEQLDKYLKDNMITPLAVRDIEQWTIVLYQTPTQVGGYILTASPDGKIHQSGGHASNNSDIAPVTIGSGGSFSQGVGSVSYTRVVFNDPEIQNSADRVVIMQEDKIMASEPVNGQKGVIIPGQLKLGSNFKTNVLVLDKEGNELYNHQKFQASLYGSE